MRTAAAVLLIVGFLQMAGDLVRSPALKGIGAAMGASPAPRVFSSVRGLETYSTRFTIEWTTRDGRSRELAITPETYARIRGPYNRRNVYGAAMAFGPVLASDPRTEPMLRAVMAHALCGDAPLLRELGIDSADAAGPVRVRFDPVSGTDMGGLPRMLEAPCR